MAESSGSLHVQSMQRIARFLLTVAITVSPAAAQDRLPLGTRVRLALPQGEMLEGKVTGGDASSLSLRVDGRGTLVVPRERILLLTAASNSVHDRAFLTGAVAGGIGALAIGAATTRCHARDRCGPEAGLTAGIAALGLGIGSVLAAGVHGAEWRAVETSAPVSGRSFDANGPEPCTARPSIQARGGLSSAGSRTASAALSLLCHGNVSIGGETGLLRDLKMPTIRTYENQQTGSYYSNYVTVEHNERRSASFVGGFGEWSIAGPMNPHVLLSGGAYRRRDEITTSTYNYDYYYYGSGGTTAMTARQSVSSFHTGMGAGVSFSIPANPHLSFGFAGRTHFLLGDFGGTISTLEATVRLR